MKSFVWVKTSLRKMCAVYKVAVCAQVFLCVRWVSICPFDQCSFFVAWLPGCYPTKQFLKFSFRSRILVWLHCHSLGPSRHGSRLSSDNEGFVGALELDSVSSHLFPWEGCTQCDLGHLWAWTQLSARSRRFVAAEIQKGDGGPGGGSTRMLPSSSLQLVLLPMQQFQQLVFHMASIQWFSVWLSRVWRWGGLGLFVMWMPHFVWQRRLVLCSPRWIFFQFAPRVRENEADRPRLASRKPCASMHFYNGLGYSFVLCRGRWLLLGMDTDMIFLKCAEKSCAHQKGLCLL